MANREENEQQQVWENIFMENLILSLFGFCMLENLEKCVRHATCFDGVKGNEKEKP